MLGFCRKMHGPRLPWPGSGKRLFCRRGSAFLPWVSRHPHLWAKWGWGGGGPGLLSARRSSEASLPWRPWGGTGLFLVWWGVSG